MKSPAAILKMFFLRKKKSNPSYSLRSLARDTKLDVGFLSRMMNGKQAVPVSRIKDLAKVLELDDVALKALKKSLAMATLEDLGLSIEDFESPRRSEAVLDYETKPFTRKELNVLNPWFAVFILELVTTEDFRPDPAWIARRLGIDDKTSVQNSLDYLIENGYVKKGADGKLQKTDLQLRLPTKSSADVVRHFHKQMLTLAVREMVRHTDKESFSKRLITNASVAINPANLPRARERLAAAQIEVAEILREGPCTEVYNLGLLLVPVSK